MWIYMYGIISKYMHFFQAAVVSTWMRQMDADWAFREKAWQQLHKNSANYIEQILEATPHKTAAIRLSTSHL